MAISEFTKDFNSSFGNGLSANDITNTFKFAVKNDIKIYKRMNLPIARYDTDKRQAYLEYADGKKEYVNN